MSGQYRKKLIEVALPLEAMNAGAVKEKAVPRHGHPQSLHLWWARRPLAAARAILFAQLVDDPSSWTELFPTDEAQNHERQRLFRLIEDLVLWENLNNESVINAARIEIARSHARSSSSSPKAKRILADGVKPEVVNEYLASEVPPVHDPFAGGGTIPLEAQRLGLRSIATDLNPVAVMINKALIEIPPKFAGLPPVHPESRAHRKLTRWVGGEGLAEDVRGYGDWMLAEAEKRIGGLYPRADLPGGGNGPVVAWLWARTVESPNPAFKGCRVPLVSSFILSAKEGQETWIAPVIQGKTYRFSIRSGKPHSAVGQGTKLGRGANFRCLLSETPIEPDFIKSEGRAGRLGSRLMAVVVEGKKGRVYVEPTDSMEAIAATACPRWIPEDPLPDDPRNFWTVQYGLTRFADLFTPRQLSALTTFCDLLGDVHSRILRDCSSVSDDGWRDAAGYADAVTTYLAFCVSKMADWCSAICGFIPGYGKYRDTFARQAIPMTWDYAELNPFGEAVGSWRNHVEWVSDAIAASPRSTTPGSATLCNAENFDSESIVSTDPPYYDNISYADLSDFFYVWLRKSLRSFYPDVFSTVLAPKENELVASPYRHGGKENAERFFLDGMRRVLGRFAACASDYAPSVIYYAFRQNEVRDGGASSTGWETFISAILEAGHSIEATMPIRTEREGRSNSQETNALASSIVFVCRKRPASASATTRGEFRRMLRKELPSAVRKLQQGNIAPVDVAQASIGPGIAIFSRHKRVVEADGKLMSVRSALQLINEVLDEHLASGEGDFDADTRFAITWYEQYGWHAGPYGEAETLAKARNVSVSGVVEAGICKSAAGKVRILKRAEIRPLDYDPATDDRPTVWEFTQHLIRALEDDGEEAAARLLKKLGSAADATRELAYRLYNTCERRKWAEDARSYNALILAWPELEKLASRMGDDPAPAAPSQGAKGKKPAKAAKAGKKQQSLFEEDDG